MSIEVKNSHGVKSQTESGYQFPDILYIMGTGRSGTTILEILLTNNPGIFGVGEATHIFQDGFTNDEICSCGKPASVCDHWSSVRQRCNWQNEEISKLNKLFIDIAWHSQFPKVASGLLSSSQKEIFAKTNKCLFQASAGVSGAKIVVDSSKYAGRALELSRAFPKKVKVICLTRTPAGLVNAFKKNDTAEQKPKSLFGTFYYYFYTMTCFRIAIWLLKSDVLRIRYEDMIANPQETLSRIESWSGIDMSQTKNILTEKQWLESGHIVTGNRLRMLGRLQFRTGHSNKQKYGLLTKSVILFMSAYKLILGF